MINIMVGTVPEGIFKGRYTFYLTTGWYAEYQRDGNVVARGRFCSNDEDVLLDPELGEVHKTLYVMEIQGPGKIAVAQVKKSVVGMDRRYRFYQTK